jgi:hypothetical protein
MTGSRGYVCTDGPLAGTVLMLPEEAVSGSLWIVSDGDIAQHVYRFIGNHFEHAPQGPADPSPRGEYPALTTR